MLLLILLIWKGRRGIPVSLPWLALLRRQLRTPVLLSGCWAPRVLFISIIYFIIWVLLVVSPRLLRLLIPRTLLMLILLLLRLLLLLVRRTIPLLLLLMLRLLLLLILLRMLPRPLWILAPLQVILRLLPLRRMRLRIVAVIISRQRWRIGGFLFPLVRRRPAITIVTVVHKVCSPPRNEQRRVARPHRFPQSRRSLVVTQYAAAMRIRACTLARSPGNHSRRRRSRRRNIQTQNTPLLPNKLARASRDTGECPKRRRARNETPKRRIVIPNRRRWWSEGRTGHRKYDDNGAHGYHQ